MAFFNEFPHTRTYDSDLAWLIERMKEILSRMDTLENKMRDLEELVTNFINTFDIEQIVREFIEELIRDGRFDEILMTLMSYYNRYKVLWDDQNYDGALDSAFLHRILLPEGASHQFTDGRYCQAMMSGGMLYINIRSLTINGLPTSSAFTMEIENTDRAYMTEHFGAYVPTIPKQVAPKYLTRRADSMVTYVCTCYCDENSGIKLEMRTSTETRFNVSELSTMFLPVIQTNPRIGV